MKTVKKTDVALAVEISLPVSNKDAGYKIAKHGEGSKAIAQWVMDKNPEFPNKVEEKLKSELYDGFALRSTEIVGDTFTILSKKENPPSAGNADEGQSNSPKTVDDLPF